MGAGVAMTNREQGTAIDPEEAKLVAEQCAKYPLAKIRADRASNLCRWALARDAEATRLKQENARLKQDYHGIASAAMGVAQNLAQWLPEAAGNPWMEILTATDRLKSENARLRAALDRVVDVEEAENGPCPWSCGVCLACIARAALKEGQ